MDYFIVSLKERNQENLENKQVNPNNFKLVGKICEKYGGFVRIVFAVQYISAGTKRRSQVTGQVTGHRAQVTGYRAQGTGHRLQGTGHRSQVTGHRAQKTQ